MSLSALAAAMALTGAPGGTDARRIGSSISLPAPALTDQEVRLRAVSAEPPARSAQSPSTTEQTQPAPGSSLDRKDIIVTARPRTAPGDPLQKVNARSFALTQAVDEAFVGPVALAYAHTLPGPVRSGLRNFLSNLHEPDVFLNFMLQLKPGKAGETLGRFAINSTIGGAGFFDVAKRRPFNLPRRPNGFADTFGYYGVKPGPYLFLPLLGATTPRDFVGLVLDRLLLPLSVGKPFTQLAYTVPTGVLSTLDHRARFDEQLQKLRDGTDDPYAARRDFYLKSRKSEIDELRDSVRSAGRPTPAPPNPSADSSATPAPQGIEPAAGPSPVP